MEELLAEFGRATPPGSVIVFDCDLRIVDAQGSLHENAATGAHASEALDPATWAIVEPLWRRAVDGETTTIEHPGPDGRMLVETTVRPLHAAGRVIGGMSIDIEVTEIRARELATATVVRQFEQAFEHAPVGTLLLRGRRIERANRAIAAALAVPADELVGQDPLDFVSLRDRAAALASLKRLAVGEVPPPAERQLVCQDGGVREMELHFTPVDVAAAGEPLVMVRCFDRTRELRAERERRRLAELLNRSFDDAPVGMALVALDGHFLRVNRALCQLLGLPADALLERDFQSLTHPDDLGLDLALLQECLDGERERYALEKRYVRADGRVVETLLSVSLVRDDDGEPAHFVSHVADHTELRATRRAFAARDAA